MRQKAELTGLKSMQQNRFTRSKLICGATKAETNKQMKLRSMSKRRSDDDYCFSAAIPLNKHKKY